MLLAGKTAIISGAAGPRGIGFATAKTFAAQGARVAILDIDGKAARAAAAELGKDHVGVSCDVTNRADCERSVGEVAKAFGKIDILINNAGVNLMYKTVAELTLDEWNRVVGTNLTGTFLCCRAVLPAMMSLRCGRIVNVSSIGGRHGAAGRTPYRPTKAALINFTECLAAEVKKYGIDVNCVCPGPTDTDMMRDITGGHMPAYVMKPEEVASVILFLASDESSAITGTAVDAFGTANPLLGSDIDVAQRGKK